jgi:hypothetical protein
MENLGIYFVTIWSILRPLQICYGHMVYFEVICYISPRFGILYQEKSGNSGQDSANFRRLGAGFVGRNSTIECTCQPPPPKKRSRFTAMAQQKLLVLNCVLRNL